MIEEEIRLKKGEINIRRIALKYQLHAEILFPN